MTVSGNRLNEETSLYLLQHRDNPVHWQPWSAATLTAARDAGKPILLSVGYAACHWCHVMAHESFEDTAIANVMNELFINIKVDREERPDIDSIYQSALQMMGEQGGWPLTMFLTPDGEPFWGGTYFPPTARYGRPGFAEILKSANNAFHRQKDQIATNIAALRNGLEKMSKPEGGGTLTLASLDTVATSLLRTIDPITGGTAGAPKFPQPTIFQFIWRAYRRTGSSLFRDAVTLTLNHICQGGIYDHLGGGFARYSTDAVWLAPHFEKMLYDNALLIELLCDVWLENTSSLYEARIRETIAWALRELRVETDGQSAFVSAYDADSEGEEGKFYVWSETEIDALLGDAAPQFKAAYDVGPQGNWEGKVILNRSHQLLLGDDAEELVLKNAREKLLAVRADRIWPSRDDKVLADWNGLMIAALVRAAVVFDEPDWLTAAKSAFAFIRTQMADEHRLHHSWCSGKAAHPGVLEDYANMSRAALALHEASGDDDFLSQAEDWMRVADDHHWDTANGGYFMSADDTADILVRPKPIHDNATPPGNGVIAEVLARLYHLTGNALYRERFDALISALVPPEADKAIYQLSLLMGFETMERAVQIVIVGVPDSAETLPTGLVRDALLGAPATRHLIRLSEDAELPDTHPAHGKTAIDGKQTAYVCIGTTCTLPLTRAEDLRDHLRKLSSGP